MRYINEVGNKYGRLTVIEKSSKKSKSSTVANWLCLCECGNTTIVGANILRNHKTISCGCSKFTNKVGNRYNKLTVLRRDESDHKRWICRCDCGNVVSIKTNLLQKKGGTGSCGCLEDIITVNIGQKFGKLTVVSKIDNTPNIWECSCECGKSVQVTGHKLMRGDKLSCVRGCYQKMSSGEASFNSIHYDIKRSAKKRGYSWELTKEDVKKITSQNCFYCNCPPRQVSQSRSITLNGDYFYNGIDRVDNKRGYEIDNVVPCCKSCNIAKHTMSQEEFKSLITRIYSNWASSSGL